MPAAWRTVEPRPSAPTTSGAAMVEPSFSLTLASPGPTSTPSTLAGARTSIPAAVTACAKAVRMRRFSSM
ncbi:hypothetical protein D3C72_2354460 [compost metagenome]